jgi:hypothetical protein
MRQRLTPAVRRYWPELAAGLTPILIFWQLVIGNRVLYWGLPALQFVPWRDLANDALRQGHLPLWTPLLGMGAPLMANHQSAVFYPPNWISLLLPPEVAISLLAVLHLSLAGVGMVRLARQIGLGDFASAVSGLAFALCGYLTGRMWFITINNAIAWLPWIVLYATPAPASQDGSSAEAGPARGGRPTVQRLLVLSGLLSLQLLSGHAQSAFYTLLIAGGWVAWQSFFPLQRPARSAPHPAANLQLLIPNLVLFSLAVLLALGLTALQLVPTYELLRQSPRADAAAYDFAVTLSLWPWRLLTFVVPDLFGHPADHNYWGYATYWEDNAYLGLLPLAFALYALFQIRPRREPAPGPDPQAPPGLRSVTGFAVLVLLAAILLALGQNTPLFPFFYRYVPGFGLFQAPARMLIGYTFAVSLLAGVGAQAWAASHRKRYWSRLGIAGSAALLVLGLAGWYFIGESHLKTFGIALARTALLAVAMFLLLLQQPPSPVRWHWAALAFIALDLGLAGLRATPVTDRALYERPGAQRVLNGRVFHYAQDEYDIKFGRFFSFRSFDPLDVQGLRDSLLPNLAVIYGFASANNFDPLVTSRHAGYLRAMESSPQLLDLATVQIIIRTDGAFTIRPDPIRRLRIVYDSRTVDGPQAALALIADPAFDPDSEVILEPGPIESLPALALDPNRYSAAVTLERPGYVVLSDTAYPGWRAFVDGRPQPLLIADYNFRAVAVPEGVHTLLFEYAPFSVTLGLLISAAASLAWAALLVWSRQ